MKSSVVVVCLIALLSDPLTGQEPAENLGDAFKRGKFSLTLRLRYEEVSDDQPAVSEKEARAFTLRTAGAFQTLPWHRLHLHLEVEDVLAIGNELYDNRGAGSLSNGVTDRPAIADPDSTEVNQARLVWSGLPQTTVDVGRREILLDNERFVGPSGWRQNHQSFDALTVVNESLERVAFTYAYLDRVHRIFGDSKPQHSHLLNVALTLQPVKLTGYAYLLDYQRPEDLALSTRSFGVLATGSRSLPGGPELLYDVELAEQRDHAENPGGVDVGYRRLDLGVAFPLLRVRAGLEVLEGAPGRGAFQTPLATLHKWNGWADRFLVTPPAGLQDAYVNVGGSPGSWSWTVVYHRFEAASKSLDYGDEVDLEVLYRSAWKQTFALKAALYHADRFSFDTEKVWLYTTRGF